MLPRPDGKPVQVKQTGGDAVIGPYLTDDNRTQMAARELDELKKRVAVLEAQYCHCNDTEFWTVDPIKMQVCKICLKFRMDAVAGGTATA